MDVSSSKQRAADPRQIYYSWEACMHMRTCAKHLGLIELHRRVVCQNFTLAVNCTLVYSVTILEMLANIVEYKCTGETISRQMESLSSDNSIY